MIVPAEVMPTFSMRFIRAQILSYLNAQTGSCVLGCAWVWLIEVVGYSGLVEGCCEYARIACANALRTGDGSVLRYAEN